MAAQGTDVNSGVFARHNRLPFAIDIITGLLFYFVAKFTDLQTAAIVGVVVGFGLVLFQRITKIDVTGGLALFGILMLCISAGLAVWLNDDEWIKLRGTITGLIAASFFIIDGARGGPYIGKGLARYMPYSDIHAGRFAIVMGVIGLIMAALNYGAAKLLTTDNWLFYKTFIDNFRWKNVPFYLRTGKRMKKRYSEIVINFKEIAHNIFPSKEKLNNNKLIIRLQPEERIELIQMTKIPGPGGYRYKPIALKLDYIDSFKERFPDAYERLIIDVIRGNQTLFMRQDELQAAWTYIESITNSWKSSNMSNVLYEAGTWGPGDLILDENESWITKSWRD